MESHKAFLFLTILLFFSINSISAIAQGICVAETFRVNSVSGKVMAHLDKGDTPLYDITIKITKKNKPNKIIREVKTDDNGLFNFGKLSRGSYSLVASYPSLNNFYLDLLISSKDASKNKQIIIWLGADFLKPCSGSYAELKEK
jgi:hypothetical protein